MYVFVVTGRAGGTLWPAKVFRDGSEMPAKMFCDVAGSVGNACRENLKLFRSSELWAKMNIQQRHDCEKVLTAPIDVMDDQALLDPELDTISYDYQRVALHD